MPGEAAQTKKRPDTLIAKINCGLAAQTVASRWSIKFSARNPVGFAPYNS
jgi:hypothetical protein